MSQVFEAGPLRLHLAWSEAPPRWVELPAGKDNLKGQVIELRSRVRRVLMIAFGLWLVFAGGLEAAGAAQPPNIVLIVADDLGYGDLGCYGSEVNETPNIDALAAGGVRFTDYHTSGPMCTPTRVSLLTGRYQQRFGAHFDLAILGVVHHDVGLPLEAVTLAEALKPQGYATACFGKWHLGYLPRFLPHRQGFDEFRGLASGDGDHHTHIDRQGNEDWWHNGEIRMEDGYTADLLTEYSVDFIEANRDRPFFLYVPHLAIHFPWQGPGDPPHREKGKSYENDKWGIIPEPGNVAPHVKAMVESLDQSVGEILAALKRLELDERTIVVFTSDNGGYLNYGKEFGNISSNGPFRGQKGSLYEGGHRVPLIVSWPGKVRSAETDEVAHSNDLFPTLVALSGSSTDELKVDGLDLSPLLLRGESIPERMLFWRARSQRAVRDGPWKLCVTGKKTELYDLENDPAEAHDLSAREPERVRQLSDAWAQWEADVNESAQAYVPAPAR